MESVIAALKDTPIPTILVIAGIVFLLLAIAGQLAGRIAVAPERQRWAAIIGGVLLVIGVVLHVLPQVKLTTRGTEEVPASRPSTPPTKDQPPQSSGVSPSTQPQPSRPESSMQASTENKESNNDITNATLITEGTAVRGSIATKADRDFFTLKASSTKTRVILRKQFHATVDVYDHVEQKIADNVALGDQSNTLSFESTPGPIYFILVKSWAFGAHGDYELVVRKE
jgi:hypothetical protein